MFFDRRPSRWADQAGLLLTGAATFGLFILLSQPSKLSASDGIRQDANLAAPRATEYRLGAADKVRVKVYAWRAARDEVFEWAAVNGEYTVGSAGYISVPLIGEVVANGVTTADLAREISSRLKHRIGLVESPDAAVEILQFRPFYVAGDVEKPGEYAYRPGMILIQALTIAGGRTRLADPAAMRLEREAITKTGEIEQIESELTVALARKARLDAEFADEPQIEFPQRLARASANAFETRAMNQERAIFASRRDAHTTQLTALEQLCAYLRTEISSLEAQVRTFDREVDIAREEYNGIKELVTKKLVIETRRLALKRGLAQVEGNSLRLGSLLTRAKQDLSRAEIAILELNNARTKDITAERAATEALLALNESRLKTAELLLHDTEVLAPRLVSDRRRNDGARPAYTILRQINGIVSEIRAGETTTVFPGDTIKVEMRSRNDSLSAEATPATRLTESVVPRLPEIVAPASDQRLTRNEAGSRNQY